MNEGDALVVNYQLINTTGYVIIESLTAASLRIPRWFRWP